jgi:hypothetical protein
MQIRFVLLVSNIYPKVEEFKFQNGFDDSEINIIHYTNHEYGKTNFDKFTESCENWDGIFSIYWNN